MEPLVDFIRYMPVVGFVPLTIIWIGIGDSQKWSIVFIGTFFQEVLLVMDNVKRVPKELVDIGQTLGLKDVGILRRIILRASAPAIWDTLRISLGWAWTWIVLAELVAANTGLGYRISAAQRFFNTETIIGYLHGAGPAGPHHGPGDEGDGSLDVPLGRAMTDVGGPGGVAAGPGAPLLRIRGVTKTFPGRPPVDALSPVDLDLAENEFVSLVGTSRLRQVHAAGHRGGAGGADRRAWCSWTGTR